MQVPLVLEYATPKILYYEKHILGIAPVKDIQCLGQGIVIRRLSLRANLVLTPQYRPSRGELRNRAIYFNCPDLRTGI